ncbi:DUF2971 family protein [Rhizobium sp. ERR 1071]|uniref:DUF2971 domain-containing protein n=1 Tax=Rhizobium sp. ERR 1071 TaxID=2572677 RepID=UPI0011992F9B|nr:DUF2971 domain-containing protein [Rhizobium sp. ERR1071]TWB20016.1 DUF2971 family protein [Rhizobium sp. ERR1071]
MNSMTETLAHLSLGPGADPLDESRQTPRLYHYTSVGGLLGIIRSRVLWATDISFLNDSEEFRHGIKIAANLVAQRVKGAQDNDRQLLEELQKVLAKEHWFPAYVVSFTEHGDLLSQWRGYSPEGGASLGFTVEGLRRVEELSKFRLSKCIYDDDRKHAIANEFLDTLIEQHRSSGSRDPRQVLFTAQGFILRFYQMAACFKDSAFSEENEWRFVSPLTPLDNQSIRYRATNRMIVPYYELPLTEDGELEPSLRFDRIVLGPGSQLALMQNALLRLCLTTGVAAKEVAKSKVPYRSL